MVIHARKTLYLPSQSKYDTNGYNHIEMSRLWSQPDIQRRRAELGLRIVRQGLHTKRHLQHHQGF